MIDAAHASNYPVAELQKDIEARRKNVVSLEWAITENNEEIDNMLAVREQFDVEAIDKDVAARRERNGKHAWAIVEHNKAIEKMSMLVAAKEAVR
ncbi:MAG: hypothetical protein ACTSYX_02905 [Candidatus Thorarchaeota archaeon]